MVQKRPLVVDSYVVSSKHPKIDESHQLVSSFQFTSKDVGWKPYISGKGYDGSTNSLVEHDDDSETCNTTHLPKESAEISAGRNSNSSWASSCISEEDINQEASFDNLVSPEKDDSNNPSHILASPEKDDYDYPSRTLARSRDTYSYLLNLPPQKLVAIGLDYQAEVPEWCPHGASDTSECHSGKLILHPETSMVKFGDQSADDNKFLGTCLTPMPGLESSVCQDDRIGYGDSCSCVDPGSMSCVRQHIVKAREDLRRMVGHEIFVGLGFQEMGEVVAEKWSNENEQVFKEVVLSNPSSAGKNFWDCLSAVFPSRTKNEIVSYYYNVFILRRRATQNRCISMNIDSDDDECHESEDEFTDSDDNDDPISVDQDSGEPPACRGVPLWSKIYNDSHEYSSGVVKNESHQHNADLASGLKGDSTGSKTYPLNYFGNDDIFLPSQESLLDVWGSHDSNDYLVSSSCTGAEHQASKLKTDHEKCSSTSHGVIAKGGCEYFSAPCDTNMWDFGYSSCPSNDVDLLPTCFMMEEVFGVAGDSNNIAGDDKLV